MQDELSYIDNIIRDKLTGPVVRPETSWEDINPKLTNVVAESSLGFFSVTGNFFKTRLFVVTVVILSVLTVGIFLIDNNSGNGHINKDALKDNINNESVLNNEENAKKSDPIIKDSLNNMNESDLTEKNSNDVVIKLEVPVHKNIIIKKEIIIKDTIN